MHNKPQPSKESNMTAPTENRVHAAETLNQVQAAGEHLNELKKMRDLHQETRDRAAWSLLVHERWTNPAIRKLFGTASHDAWTKSRERLRKTFPDVYVSGKIDNPKKLPKVHSAKSVLELAANFVADFDRQIEVAAPARKAADKAAYAAGNSIADIAKAAGVTRQAMWNELTEEAAK